MGPVSGLGHEGHFFDGTEGCGQTGHASDVTAGLEEPLFMITMDIPAPPPTHQVVHSQTLMQQQPSPEDAKKKRELTG